MKLITIILLLISSTLTAQTVRVAGTTSTSAQTVYTKAGTDTLIARLERRIAALEARTIQLTTGAADTLRNISTHLTANRNRIEAVNLNWWRADQALIGRIDSGVAAQRIVNTATTAQINGVQGQVKQLTEQQSGVISRLETTEKQQAAQQAVLNKVEAWIRSY